MQSVAELIEKEMRDEKVHTIGREGLREGQWALVDFGSVVVHVFHQFTREVYDLESLWRDAPRLHVAPPASVGSGA